MGSDYLGSFGATVAASTTGASSILQPEAANLGHACRSQLTATTIGSGVSGQSCASGTGTTYLWSEGNWQIGVETSNAAGPADSALPGQIAAFLHANYLPPPSSIGVISITANGGPSSVSSAPSTPVATTLTASWTEGSDIVTFSDAWDALGGLQMVASEASY